MALCRPARLRPPFADVVKKRGEKEGARVCDLGGQARRKWELVRELPSRELPQTIDGCHRVNVDRVHVIDVVVHASNDG